MKLGNISQTLVQVPNFFINRKARPIETFELNNDAKTEPNINLVKKKNLSLKQKIKTELEIEPNFLFKKKIKNKHIKKRNSNFSDNKILTTYYDININNNPRYKGGYWINLNKEKYLPNYYYMNNTNTNNLINKTQIDLNYFPGIIDMNKPKEINKNKKHKRNDIYTMMNKFYSYKKYKENSNINKLLSPDLRDELMNDTRNLIDKINMNYDLTSWNKFDTRTTSNRLIQTEYSPITNAVKNSPNIRDKFVDTINQKVMGLKTINSRVKKNNIKMFYERNITEDKNTNNNQSENLFDSLLDKNRSNLLNLKYNNITKLDYNENDKMFIKENEYITKKINRKSNLYKEFPSKTRMEFNTKKIFKYKELFKINKPINDFLKKDKYGDKAENLCNKNENNSNEKMWTRPLHKDAFNLVIK